MIVKCWNLDLALGVFGGKTLETPGLPIKELQRILFDALHEIKTKLKPEFIKDFLEEVDGYMAFDPDLEIALMNYRLAFNESFNTVRWGNNTTEVHGEETDAAKLDRRAYRLKDFLLKRFKDPDTKIAAGRAMLYFKRDAKLKLMSTFMVDRDHGFLVAEHQVAKNVRDLKQTLLNTIVDYLKSRGYRDDLLGLTELFDEFGEYTGALEDTDLRKIIDSKLTIGTSFTTDYLKEQYEKFRKQDEGWEKSRDFIEAYNAKIFLDDFDRAVTMFLGNIVKPGNSKYGDIDNGEYETKFHRATNMWGNGIGDDVENIADIVSIVTLELIQTSKRYSWKGGPMKDLYLSFLDFNYIVTKIKSLAYNPIAKNIILNDRFFDLDANKGYIKTSGTTKTLEALKALKRKQGYPEDQLAPTFEDVVSFISDNPLRHIHTIFDLLCNTNILSSFGGKINANDKNLIWSLGKEMFGHWDDEVTPSGTIYSRSLYDLHRNSLGDRIFEIITLIVDSVFADQYIQYYEDADGNLKMRMLLDYSVSQIKNRILLSMKETHGTYDPERFRLFLAKFNKALTPTANITLEVTTSSLPVLPGENKKKAWRVKNPNYTPNTPGSFPTLSYSTDFVDAVTVKLNSGFELLYKGGKLTTTIPRDANKNGGKLKYLESIWKSKDFRDFIKSSTGIDFNTDVELASAYEETFRLVDPDGTSYINYTSLVEDIARLGTSVIYNQYFNNIVVPKALQESGRARDKRNVELLRDIQFSGQKIPRINQESGTVEMVSDTNKESYLANLATATATVRGLLTSALVKTGEGTALASQVLSCLRTSHPYQILVQNKSKNSATKSLNYVNNENGFFQGVIGLREFKSDAAVRVNTDMSSAESYAAAFLGGFVGAYINSEDTSTINRNGNAYFVPAVYSDKSKQDVLRVLLNAISKHLGISYKDMTDAQVEEEMKYELGTMYDTIIDNINEENLKFLQILNSDSAAEVNMAYFGDLGDNVQIYRDVLERISDELCSATDLVNLAINSGKTLGKTAKALRERTLTDEEILVRLQENPIFQLKLQSIVENATAPLTAGQLLVIAEISGIDISEKIAELRQTQLTSLEIIKSLQLDKKLRKELGGIKKKLIVKQMHEGLTLYNKTHRRNPIEMCEHVHYLFNGDGNLVPNDTLLALWGRFNADAALNQELGLTNLYPDGHQGAAVVNGFFKEKDIQTAIELLTDGMDIYLLGNLAKENQEEIKFLRNSELCKDWHTPSYKMAIAKVFNPDTNTWDIVSDPKILAQYAETEEGRARIQIHPMLSKLNRLSYLAAQQYTSAVGGAHYVYKGKGKDVLAEEASRWLASNKRNVCYPSTVHKYQNKTLNGVPKVYQIAPIEDFKSVIYSIMGDLDSHAPLDGGMMVNPWFPILENNSLGGEAAGLDKKQFGTYYYEKYAAGGIIKTAGFALTNQRLRNSPPYRALCKNMTNRTWIKEFSDREGSDIPEYLDITRDYKGNVINWVLDDNGHGTYYYRKTNGGKGWRRFKLAGIEAIYSNGLDEVVVQGDASEAIAQGFRPTNKYRIYEFPVDINGEIDTTHPDIAVQLEDKTIDDLSPILRLDDADENGEFLIDTNWKLYNFVFGGMNSLSLKRNGKLDYSENSVYLMVHALNNIGYTRTTDNNDENFGKEQYTLEELGEERVQDLDDLWQPLKYSDISYAPNIGALKSTQMNVNPKEGMYSETDLNAMNIIMALLGIQLDKEHHADESEVSMPTQIISACANKGYTIHYSSKLYKALSTLTEIAISDCMDGIMENLPGNENKGTLLTEVATIIVDKLIHSLDDNEALTSVLEHLIEKLQNGGKLSPEDVIGKVPFSDPALYNKVYNDLASHLTNSAIKMKFPGSLAVICPGDKMEPMFGDRRLSAYADAESSYIDEEGTEITGIPENIGLQIEQARIRNYPNPLLVFDENINFGLSVQERLNLAADLNTQHHYWIEWNDENGNIIVDELGQPFREKVTLSEPNEYYQVKDWLAYGGEEDEKVTISGKELSRKGMRVARIYEDIMDARELGAFNVRYESVEKSESGLPQKFCIFDLDSIRMLFLYPKLSKDLDTVLTLLSDKKFVGPLRAQAEQSIRRLLAKNSPESSAILEEYYKKYRNAGILTAIKLLSNASNTLEKDFIEAAFKVCKVLTYKTMEKDLFKISKDYEGSRQIWANGQLITVNPNTIKTLAYELIMPKIYQTRFGLEEGDLVQEILANPEFFTERAIERVKQQHVAESCFHYELKNFNGHHVYIYDSRLGEPDPEIFIPSRTAGDPVEVRTGEWERQDVDGNYVHGLSSGNDRIMLVGKLGYEVIVTDNPEYYFEHMSYNLAAFSNETVNEETLQTLVSNLKETKSRSAKKFLRSVSGKNGQIRNFKDLTKRNDALKDLSLEFTSKTPPEVVNLVKLFTQEGKELFASFSKSLDIIAGRIPAQSLLSFMPQRVVAFDNNDINSAYVSTFLLFLQGSDLDIDAVNLLGSDFDDNGKYVIWSNLADITTIEQLEASQELPFPTGKETPIVISNSSKSFFDTYGEYFEESENHPGLFDIDRDIDTHLPILGENRVPTLTLRDLTPERLQLLAKFLTDIERNGLTIKGEELNDGSWLPSKALVEEWENLRYNPLRDLGFETPEAAYNALMQIKQLVDSHNLYINLVDNKTREMMTKNLCMWAMYQVCSTSSNLTELCTGVDVATAPIKDGDTGAVAQSPYNGDDKKAAPGNHNTMHRSFQEGLIGKQCVGIGAVSIKVNSTSLYYADSVIANGTDAEKQRLLLPVVNNWGERLDPALLQRGDKNVHRGYKIGNTIYQGLANLYDKSAERLSDEVNLENIKQVTVPTRDGGEITVTSSLPEEIINLIASGQLADDIPLNVAMSLAAMLSVAVDNAKDLALAKINAGPKMFGLYAYGISLGMDIRELAKIINTPQGRAISKLCEGNIINGQMGASDALGAIEKLEGKKLYHDLHQFDVLGLQTTTDRNSGIERTAAVGLFGCMNASDVVTQLFSDYYKSNIMDNPKAIKALEFKPNTRNRKGKIDLNPNSLDTMLYQISLLGKIDECISIVTNPSLNMFWNLLTSDLEGFRSLDNAATFEASVHLLLEHCSKYGNLVNTYYLREDRSPIYLARDLKILAGGAKEMQILGRLLSSNKGVKSTTEEGIAFLKHIENAVIDRKKVMGIAADPEDRIDPILFCMDDRYREEAIDKYELVKHSINILDVISKADHMRSYIRTCAIPYAAFKMGSAKFRARDQYYDAVVDSLNLTSSLDKDNAARGIESAVNYRMLQNWLGKGGRNMYFWLPEGSTVFTGRDQVAKPSEKGLYIPLSDPYGNGLATFKYYMEHTIIPNMKSDPSYMYNSFIQGLTSFELTKTGTHASVSAVTLEGSMMPITESLEILLLTYEADFNSLYALDFPGSAGATVNVPSSYIDAFYIYSQYVFGGRRGPRSLMALFSGETSALVKEFQEYEALVDANLDFVFTLEELQRWCAPNGSSYNPNSNFFYGKIPNEFGSEYLKKAEKPKRNMEGDPGEEPKKASKYEKIDLPMDAVNRGVYLNPSLQELTMGENSYSLGVNMRILDIPKFANIVLDELDPEQSLSLVANPYSGEYSLVANGVLTERSEKILKILEKNMEYAYITVPDFSTSTYVRGIDQNMFSALIEEAKHEADNNC